MLIGGRKAPYRPYRIALAMSLEDLTRVVLRVTGAQPRVFAGVTQALDALLPTSPDGLVVTGSITTAGEARAWLTAGQQR